jgi:hypothetical protein
MYFYTGTGVVPVVEEMQENWSTNRRFSEEWYICQRCGVGYPRHRVKMQNGLVVCDGASTMQCADKPGHAAAFMNQDTGYERTPEELPHEEIEL